MKLMHHRRVKCSDVVSIRAVALHKLSNFRVLTSSVLNNPFVGRTPELWMRLVVSVPVLGSSWRIKTIFSFFRGDVTICAKHVVRPRVRGRSFGGAKGE